MSMTRWSKLSAVAAGLVGGVCLSVVRRLVTRARRLSPTGRLVAITGCDSGVGLSAARHCFKHGLRVVAMVLHPDSIGARYLSKLGQGTGDMEVISVDVTKLEQVQAAVEHVTTLLDNNKDLEFHALINNAGVMVFGETEWQTEHTMSLQLDVNLVGTLRVTKNFAPLLRKYKGRVINVTSHCAFLPLPGLAVYAASKAGMQAWSDALRVEWAKYGISVISLVPGALFQQTNILSRQTEYAQEMEKGMSPEAAGFYGQYFTQFQQLVCGIAGEKRITAVQSNKLYKMLDSAVLDARPRVHYHDTPWRYTFYHTLAGISPAALRDRLVDKFTGMPAFKP